jgi:hypothetical protein
MTFTELNTYAKEVMKLHPELQEDIQHLVNLADMEIEDGANEDHECELAVGDINALINGEL